MGTNFYLFITRFVCIFNIDFYHLVTKMIHRHLEYFLLQYLLDQQ